MEQFDTASVQHWPNCGLAFRHSFEYRSQHHSNPGKFQNGSRILLFTIADRFGCFSTGHCASARYSGASALCFDNKSCVVDTVGTAAGLIANKEDVLRPAFLKDLDIRNICPGLGNLKVIKDVLSELRVGSRYIDISSGISGCLLPLSAGQIMLKFKALQQKLTLAFQKPNRIRKDFPVDHSLATRASSLGTYDLTVDTSSNNFTPTTIQKFLKALKTKRINVFAYQSVLQDQENFGHSAGLRKLSFLEVFGSPRGVSAQDIARGLFGGSQGQVANWIQGARSWH